MLRSGEEHLDELGWDRDVLLGSLKDVTSGPLDSLTPEERHQLHKKIRLKGFSHPHGPLEVSGTFTCSQGLGRPEPTSTSSHRGSHLGRPCDAPVASRVHGYARCASFCEWFYLRLTPYEGTLRGRGVRV